jgi:hypothetical protein
MAKKSFKVKYYKKSGPCLCANPDHNDHTFEVRFEVPRRITKNAIVCRKCFKKFWDPYRYFLDSKGSTFPIGVYLQFVEAIKQGVIHDFICQDSYWSEFTYNAVAIACCVALEDYSVFFRWFDAFRVSEETGTFDDAVIN